MSIEQQLNIKFPIYWNDSAIEEKFASYLINKIIATRPVNIVELGSGISSLIIIKTLEKLGYDYNFISVDSDNFFLNETKNLLISEGVYDESKIRLIYAPIEKINLNKNSYLWYKSNELSFNFDRIDLLFVDGPLGTLCQCARYPAINIFNKYLKDGSLVLLHDAKRLEETEIVKKWLDENSKIKQYYNINTERGGSELRF